MMNETNPTPETPDMPINNTKPPLQEFLEHQVNAAQETVKALQALVPPDFRTHSRAARKEFLLSFKVLLDGAMTTVERELNKSRQSGDSETPATSSSGPSTTGKSKVKVEVS